MTRAISSVNPVVTFDLDELNQQFENAHPREILTWCLENVPTGLVQTTAFGVTGMVIIDILYRVLSPQPPVPVLFLNTLHHFPQTLTFVEKAKSVYKLDLHVYKTLQVNSRSDFSARYGHELWHQDIEKFHYLTKVEPLQRGLAQLNTIAWINGRRRDQAETRTNISVFELDKKGRIKINPLANWTRQQTWAYIAEHSVIYHPLHDQGYASIGDEPLTTRVDSGEHERAGRWRGMAKTECGIHL